MALALLSSCSMLEHDVPQPAEKAAPSGKVKLSFKVAVPGGPETKAMGNRPLIDNMYVAVFGGSGFYNEWVQAEIEDATENNYDNTSATVYKVNVTLTMSDNRLRLHFIANCPEKFKSNPPITGISAQDLEEVVIGKLRSQITDTYNDSYWQKVILPNGVKASVIEVADEHGNISEEYDHDGDGNYIASTETINQFPNPIPLVRNFARIYLRNLTTDVTIERYGLVFAPAEGAVAPIVSQAYPTNVAGEYITDLDSYSGKIYYENFIRNYQDYPLLSDDNSVTKLTDDPFKYGGYSPDDIKYGTYPNQGDDANYPTYEQMMVWDSSIANDDVTQFQAPMFVYERQLPTSQHRATRVLIYAHKDGEKDANNNDLYKYYALDIVDNENNYIPLLRNQTYTVKLIKIEAGSGETDLAAAAGGSSAAVSGDIATQYVTEINDGSASISASYTEMLYVNPGTYDVFFRYVPTYAGDNAGIENNDLVTIQVGTKNEDTGTFTPVLASEASNPVFQINNGEYAVNIEKDNNTVVLYARHGSGFTSDEDIVSAATEKWGKVSYTTVGTPTDDCIDENGFFKVTRNAAIRITGTYEGHPIFRDVLVKISPRKSMIVTCRQPYIEDKIGEKEVIRVYIPSDLPRALFPLQFKIEAEKGTITPDGDILPVETGGSIVPDKTGPSYFFIKNITRTEYEKWVKPEYADLNQLYTDANDVKWAYFDCKFKSTVASSSSRVYVQNDYFDNSHNNDIFYNHTQRLFTGEKFNTDNTKPLREGTPVEYVFTMDAAHGNNTVWWDISTDDKRTASLSTSNKVLPTAVLVVLQGLQPDSYPNGTLKTNFSSGSAYDDNPNDDKNYYLYIVGPSNDTPESSLADATLSLKAKGTGTCSVQLSTLHIEENPYLYKPVTTTGTVQALNFSISPTTVTIPKDGSTTLSYTATPAYSGDVVEWSSSDMTVATVNGNGVVTGVARGTATITATLAGKTAVCDVNVVLKKTFNTNSTTVTSTGNYTLSNTDPFTITLKINSRNNSGYVELSRNTSNIISISTSGGRTITKIVFNLSNNTIGNVSVNTGNLTNTGSNNNYQGTWTGSATTVNISQNNNNTRMRLKSIEIYYDE